MAIIKFYTEPIGVHLAWKPAAIWSWNSWETGLAAYPIWHHRERKEKAESERECMQLCPINIYTAHKANATKNANNFERSGQHWQSKVKKISDLMDYYSSKRRIPLYAYK
jgi:hypothetical protein